MQIDKSYAALFERYGSPSREADIRLTAWLVRPDKLDTFDRIRHYDDDAARLIADCKRLERQLLEYRQDLAARYGELATMPSTETLKIEREPRASGIRYHVTISRTYSDGTTVDVLRETYTGQERSKALARFAELQKQRPGIASVKDIARRSWERR